MPRSGASPSVSGRKPTAISKASCLLMVSTLVAGLLAASLSLAAAMAGADPQGDPAEGTGPDNLLPVESLPVQGLRRTVRFHQPGDLASAPALVIALHGSGGDGEGFRRQTGKAFDLLAEEHGFLVAYPDALGGQWNDCRARAPYRQALSGIDELEFMRAVVRRAQARIAQPLAAVFVVGYSNGGHLAFRLAFEAPGDFAAFAAIAAHLPVPAEFDCRAPERPVSMFLVSGTEDLVNPWAGGQVRVAANVTFGTVLSAEQTAGYFRALAALPAEPVLSQVPDRDRHDGTRVEIRRWSGAGEQEVVLMVVHGGGHALPHPTASLPENVVGRTSQDINGAGEIWKFFARHARPVASQ